MFILLALIICINLSIKSVSACDYDECKSHVDFGSCGNACCKLSMIVKGSPESTMLALNSSLSTGGPDKQYIPQITAQGTIAFSDLRKFDIDVDFIGQSFHVTDNGQYTDTINFTLAPKKNDDSTYIEAFSISQIGGAYGDDGQNYYNIYQLFTSVFPDLNKIHHLDHSCMTAQSS